ncbi:hypothetical protein [Natronorubrum tibetense]|uniref:Uncharacterized protein n=1 Tax=Natronorubrum tibetense GA33 TaxID=1114856 RepID=L9W0P1_9EURY|nr:hypothetical protein [Natronorubrum tibetense]ELY42881.1 hypothetical protein C496_06092 [Natronorubrum tibetense GA33]
MSEERYRCICHTCESERLIDGLENAQEVFNEHADMAHEVELLKRQSRCRDSNWPVEPESGNDRSTTDR